MLGVEENEVSRFVDHTIVTPWETLLSDIEISLKKISARTNKEQANEIAIYFQGLKYKLEKRTSSLLVDVDFSYHKNTSIRLIDYDNHQHYTYLLFSHGNKADNYSNLYKTTILSACITALKSLEKTMDSSTSTSYPFFFAYCFVKDINYTNELIGFKKILLYPYHYNQLSSSDSTATNIHNNNINSNNKLDENNTDVKCFKGNQWLRYEISMCSNIHSKHKLYFFDGIKKLFNNKTSILKLTNKHISSFLMTYYKNNDQYFDCIGEFMYIYTYQELTSYLSNKYKPTTYSTSIVHNNILPLITTNHNNSKPIMYNIIPNNNSSCFLLDLNKLISILSKLKRNLNTTTATIAATTTTTTFRSQPYHIILQNISINHTYNAILHSEIIDNANYSTFIPSKLSPNQWKIYTCFQILSDVPYKDIIIEGLRTGSSTDNPSQSTTMPLPLQASDSWMSHCLRNLLVFYIFSHICSSSCSSCSSSSSMNNNSSSSEVNSCAMININTVEQLLNYNTEHFIGELFHNIDLSKYTDILTPQSKECFDHLCSRSSSGINNSKDQVGNDDINNNNTMSPKNISMSPSPKIEKQSQNNLNNSDNNEDNNIKNDIYKDFQNNINNYDNIIIGDDDISIIDKNDISKDIHEVILNSLLYNTDEYLEINSNDNNNICLSGVDLEQYIDSKSDFIGYWMCIYSILSGYTTINIPDIALLWNKSISSIQKLLIWKNDEKLLKTFISSNDVSSKSSNITTTTNNNNTTTTTTNNISELKVSLTDSMESMLDHPGFQIDNTNNHIDSNNNNNIDLTESLLIQKLQLIQSISMKDNEFSNKSNDSDTCSNGINQSITYLKEISLIELSTTMLHKAMLFIKETLQLQCTDWMNMINNNIAIPNQNLNIIEIINDLNLIIDQMKLAFDKLQLLSKQNLETKTSILISINEDINKNCNPFMSFILLVDSIIELINKFEIINLKIQILQHIFINKTDSIINNSELVKRKDLLINKNHIISNNTMINIILSLAMKDQYYLTNDYEMNYSYDLIRSLHQYTSQVHDWYSTDGRDLGLPTKKSFQCKYNLTHNNNNNNTNKNNNNSSTNNNNRVSQVTSSTCIRNNVPMELLYQMNAIIEKDILKVSFTIPE